MDRDGPLPLSFTQERLWFLDQLGGSGVAYHEPLAAVLEGALDVAALGWALSELVARHEVLRTRFVVADGAEGAVQVVDAPWTVELAAVPVAEDAVEGLLAGLVLAPFDLAADRMLRVGLWRTGENRHVLALVLHHIVTDGWSMGVLLREVGVLYAARRAGMASPLAALGVQYADWAAWQRRELAGARLERQLGWWRGALAGMPANLDLPTDRPRPAVQSFAGAQHGFMVPAELAGALGSLARREGATLFMVLLAAWQLVLARWSGQERLVVGTPIANRTRAESEGLIGFFANTLAVPVDVGQAESFAALLGQVRETALGAYAHQDLPFEKLVEALAPTRVLDRQPIFQTMFVLQNTPAVGASLPDLTVTPLRAEARTAKFDLTLAVNEGADGLRARLEYATDLFDAETAARIAGHWRHVLEQIVRDAHQPLAAITLATPDERNTILAWAKGPEVDWADAEPVHRRIAARAAARPEAPAVVGVDGAVLDYGMLERRANALAHRLVALGAGPDVLVGVCAERSPALVVALLAILKAGAAYLPLDAGYPAARLAFMLADARAPVVLGTTTTAALLPPLGDGTLLLLDEAGLAEEEADAPPATALEPHHLAYAIYTSGSTGTPKGVLIEHRALGNYLSSISSAFPLSSGVGAPINTPLAFDATVTSLWGPLISGKAVRMLREGTEEIEYLARVVEAGGSSLIKLTPAHLGALHSLDSGIAHGDAAGALIIGGEALTGAHVADWRARAPQVRLINEYGPTEATVGCTTYEITADTDLSRDVPIGRPITNMRVYVLDAAMEPVPVGVAGELYIGGAGLARGYLNRPALTAERFVPDPFGDGERLYRTGDRVRWRSDGELDFHGRLDQQVKLRGFRIEPGEIEAALAGLPGIAQAAVVLRDDTTVGPQLVGYVVPVEGAPVPDLDALPGLLARSLPAHMVPAAYVVLAALPLTVNGKLDRAALPAPQAGPRRHDPPQSPQEELLATVFAELLGVEQVGRGENFFELGGHSLLATQLAARVRAAFSCELPLRTVFESPTPAALAERLAGLDRASSAVSSASRELSLPLSFTQERLWFLDQLGGSGAAYHVPLAAVLEGALDVAALGWALSELVARHEVLRTRFVVADGAEGAVQVVDAPWTVELAAVPVAEDAVEGLLAGLVLAPFDLAADRMLRVGLWRTGENRHVLALVLHHIVTDGWSMGVLLREVGVLYAARRAGMASPLAALGVQYADWAAWQRRELAGARLERQLGWWRGALAGMPANLDLPTDRPRPAVQSFAGAQHGFMVPAELAGALGSLARREGATLFMVLLAAWQLVLARWSGQERLVVGTPIANRTRAESEGLIGFFANTLAVPVDVGQAESFAALLGQVRETALGAYAHQDLPFEKLVEALAPTRVLDRQPIFQTMFVLQNTPAVGASLPDLTVTPLRAEARTAKFDLTLAVNEGADGLRARLEYATDLFDAETAARIAGHWRHVLEQIVRDAHQPLAAITLATPDERNTILAWAKGPEVDWADAEPVHRRIAARAAARPEAPAVVGVDGAVLDYGMLERRANALAHRLVALGAGPDVLVGVCAERSPALVVALLAILKAGAAYLPLDAGYPAARLAFMLADARAPVVLGTTTTAALLPPLGDGTLLLLDEAGLAEEEADAPPATALEPHHLAYAIYTSGSTGTPKGVLIEHRALGNYLSSISSAFPLSSGVGAPINTPLAFDATVTSLWGPLISGKAVRMLREGTEEIEYLARVVEAGGSSLIKLTPAHLGALHSLDSGIAHGDAAGALIIGGEALTGAHVADWRARAPQVRLINEYGPTEATVGCTTYEITADTDLSRDVPIGRPITNMRVYVLDAAMEPVPVGVAGELYIGGAGLARGYLNRPALTAERFVPDPFGDGERLYRTGDRVRWRSDGELDFHGRLDQQVKLRGFRIEPGEIEAALAGLPGIAQAAVVLRDDTTVGPQLVGYVVPVEGAPVPDLDALPGLLARSLPAHMVPAAYVVLAALPLTVNGKLDRAALPAPQAGPRRHDPPQSPQEELLATVFAELLGVEQVGRGENFFELGGHSLLATQLAARVRAAFSCELPLRTVFESPTPAALAERLAGLDRASSAVSSASRELSLPLSFTQERLWFLDQLGGSGAAYHVPLAAVLEGALDVAALGWALSELVARHEVLRTRFVVADGAEGAVQVVDAPWTVELAAVPVAEDAVEGLLAGLVLAPFDLAADRMLRVGLWRTGENRHVLALVLHHIVTDGWSMGVLLREVGVLYAARRAGMASPLAALGVQYADWAAWQRRELAGARLERQLGWWRGALAGMPANLDLPTDRPRPAVQSFAGAQHGFMVPAELAGALGSLARREGATLFMVLLAAWQLVLARWSGQERLVVGTPIANRTRAESEGLIGFFANTLAVPVDVGQAESFAALLGQVRETALGAYAHQDLPFEKLVEALAPTRVLDRQPIFQTMFVLQNTPAVGASLPDLTVTPLRAEARTAKFDLTLAVNEGADGLRARLEYATDLFDAETAARIAGHWRHVLEQIVRDAHQPLAAITLATPDERNTILAWAKGPEVDWADAEPVHRRIAARAAARPEAPAVVGVDGAVLDYGMLERRANALAHRLVALGAGPDVLVGVCAERSPALVVALLAILKAGAAYLPLDAGYPAARLAFMLADARAPVVLGTTTTAALLPPLGDGTLLLLDEAGLAEEEADAPPATALEPHHLAYAIYTSGSTGTPKGVLIEHRALDNHMRWMNDAFPLTGDDVILQKTPIGFDASVWEIFAPLLAGTKLVLAGPDTHRDPLALRTESAKAGATTLQLVPSILPSFLAERDVSLVRLRQLFAGGEALTARTRRAVREELPGVTLTNLYGPTETCIQCLTHSHCVYADTDLSRDVPIGRPITNMRVYVLDAAMEPVPVGVAGELYIGGAGLARGYLNRPALTAERFVPDPFGDGERLYRTGDRVRWRSDGELDFHGRLDQQVKLRGFRIEPGEIEAALAGLPGIAQAAVVLRDDTTVGPQLVGYVVPVEGAPVPDLDALPGLLARSLPAHMVPAAYVVLAALPLTVNGKLDRAALPAPQAGPRRHDPPQSPQEELLATVFAELLGVEQVGRGENFFELGGHSLLATQLAARVRAAFSCELPLRTVFESPTPAALAERLAGLDRASSAVSSASRELSLPLSFTQERLWFLDQLGGSGAAYHVPLAAVLEGALDVAALGWALSELVARHEVLRTRFVVADGAEGAVQVVDAPWTVELAAVPVAEDAVEGLLAGLVLAPFDLAADRMLRVGLWRTGENRHVLALVLHHIVTDGWSMGVLLREVGVLYAARRAGMASPLAALGVQYADWAAWQRRELAGARLERQLGWWRGALAGMPANLDLPTDRPRPAVQSFAGAQHGFMVPAELAGALGSLARREGATLFMVLLAAWQLVLARWSGQERLVVGTPIANRTRAESEGLIGFFANTLAVPVDVGQAESFAALLGQVRETALGAYAHQDLPFEKLVEALAPTRVLDRQPIFQTMFVLQNTPAVGASLPDLTVTPLRAEARTAKFDLTLAVNEGADGLRARLEYATDLFDAETAARIAGHWRHVLEQIVRDAHQPLAAITLATPDERNTILARCDVACSFAELPCLHTLFAAQVSRNPAATALQWDCGELSYGELDEAANRLAHYLRRMGAGREQLVGICLNRSPEFIVAILAILKTGAAYLPLDPEVPSERLTLILADSEARIVVTSVDLSEKCGTTKVDILQIDDIGDELAAMPATAPQVTSSPEDLAYVIYTSGSTGVPKGVMIEHRQVSRLFAGTHHWYGFGPDDVWSLFHSPAFDVSVWEIWGALAHGGKLVIVPYLVARLSDEFHQLVCDYGVTILSQTPSAFRSFMEAQQRSDKPHRIHRVVLAGEALDMASLAPWFADDRNSGAVLVNMYGITETTVHSTYAEIERRDVARVGPSPIGVPIPDLRIYILDEHRQPVPIGVRGEIYVGGAGVARGYLNRADLTFERFIDSPFVCGDRLYKSGDIARYLADGTMEFYGRNDGQVKIRGFRIETGEIEARLSQLPGIERTVVLASDDERGGRRLIAYYVAAQDIAIAKLRAHLQISLPDYMVPAAFARIDAVPLTVNGKLDWRALPKPQTYDPNEAANDNKPRSPQEELLATVFAEVLGVERVGRGDSFFELGGHSLLTMQLAARVRTAFSCELPLRTVFESPTPAALAERLAELDRASSPLTPANRTLIQLRDGPTTGHALLLMPSILGSGMFHQRLLDDLQCAEQAWTFGLPGLDPGEMVIEGMDSLARYGLQALADAGPREWTVIGWSFGGVLGHELAQQMAAAGMAVRQVVLIDTLLPTEVGNQPTLGQMWMELVRSDIAYQSLDRDLEQRLFALYAANYRSLEAYQPSEQAIPLRQIISAASKEDVEKSVTPQSATLAPLSARDIVIPGDHHSILANGLGDLASALNRLLRADRDCVK